VPGVVSRIAAGRPVRAVWRNEPAPDDDAERDTSDEEESGHRPRLTFRVGSGEEYVKTGPGEFAGEADRLAWAGRYTPVPPVLGYGADWLHTAGLPGRSAVHPHWVARPQQAARAIGAGLRMLHDALPVDSCPWIRTDFGDAPPADRLVVCHGDACAPNTLIDAHGGCCGHVDLGALAVADRWADLAIATLSLGWNYASDDQAQLEDDLLEAYGIDRDGARIDYYRRLWQAPDQDGG
jgi:kanamycin kinase